MIWNKTAVDAQAVKELARRYEIELLAATILTRRGITAPEQLRFCPGERSPVRCTIRFSCRPWRTRWSGSTPRWTAERRS